MIIFVYETCVTTEKYDSTEKHDSPEQCGSPDKSVLILQSIGSQ